MSHVARFRPSAVLPLRRWQSAGLSDAKPVKMLDALK